MKTLIILGSSRSNGETATVANMLQQASNWDLIDLNHYKIGYYDYNHHNIDDDFMSLIRQIIHNYDTLVFATPVYWYAMSGTMKVFFDRITDLLDIDKDLGRKLRGKNMAALSCSAGNNLGDNFWLPFIESANYLGMNYLGNLHSFAEDNILQEQDKQNLLAFIRKVNHNNDTVK